MKNESKKKIFNFQNQSKILLNIDWLTLSVKDNFQLLQWEADQTFQIGDYVLHQQEKGKTSHFNQKIYVYHSGEKVATILYESNSKIILLGRSHIKFENHIFYDRDCQSIIKNFVYAFELRDIHIARLDLCVDGVFLHNFVNYFQYDKSSKSVIHRVKDVDNIDHPRSSRDARCNHSYDAFTCGSFGNKDTGTSKSAKFIRYYNKTKEIKDKSGKQYILDYFERSGFDMSIDTYRFEIEMTTNYLKKIKDLTLDQIFDFDYLCQLFNTATKKTFEFREFRTDTNVTRMHKIEFFKGLAKGILDKVKQVVKDTLRTTKIIVRRLFEDCLIGKYAEKAYEKILINETRNRLIQDNGLLNWWEFNFDRFVGDIARKGKLYNKQLNFNHI